MKFILLALAIALPPFIFIYKFNFNWRESMLFGISYGVILAEVLNYIY